MAPERVRIGVIGLGFGSKVQIPGFKSEGFEVAAVCSRTRERVDQVAKDFDIPHGYTDYRDLLRRPDLDAVSIVTPPDLHCEMTLAALDAGKHVLCEKPFAMDQIEAKAMCDKIRDTRRTGMVTHEFRFAPARAYVRELVRQGYIGELHSVCITLFLTSGRRERDPQQAWRQYYVHGGGQLAGIGSHYIDCLRDWFGEISGVFGRLFAHESARTSAAGQRASQGDADNAFGFLLTFAKGGWGSMSANFTAPLGSGVRIEIHGSKGMLSLVQAGVNPSSEGKILGARFEESDQPRELPIPQGFFSVFDERDHRLAAFRTLARRFRQGIFEGESPSPNFEDGYRCVQVIDAIKASDLQAQWMRIDDRPEDPPGSSSKREGGVQKSPAP